MSKDISNASKQPHVFLSYSSKDKEVAQRIFQELRKKGIHIGLDSLEIKPGDSITNAIDETLSASDYLVVLLSPNSVKSRWVQYELATAANRKLLKRDITLLPVLIRNADIPASLKAYQYLDLRRDFDHGVAELAERIGSVPEIDFSKLNGRRFENLVSDLLTRLGFENIKKEGKSKDGRKDNGIDFQAEYSSIDPFGVPTKQTWVIEIKFYKQARADLNSIQQLMAYISKLSPESKGLLVTNGQLTSVAWQWLESARAKSLQEIRVIDGTELKRLLLDHRDLIKRYFS
jgi:TIR domain./Restriction endonuclease.